MQLLAEIYQKPRKEYCSRAEKRKEIALLKEFVHLLSMTGMNGLKLTKLHYFE